MRAHTHTQLGGKGRKVLHLQFVSWPDHGVPEYAGPTLTYLRRVKAESKAAKGPTLIHCRQARVHESSTWGGGISTYIHACVYRGDYFSYNCDECVIL